MSDYMLMVLEDESAHAAEAPKAMAELIEKRAAFADGLRRAGKLKDSGRLHPSKEGKRVREERVASGPFAEEGKTLGAYYWVDVASVEEAAEIAKECPALSSDEVDVRPVMKGVVPEDKDKPGKIFAFAVLGNARSEEGWVKVMDTIDAETSTMFPDSFIGGVRLQAPKTGKRVARHAMFDGPFLESKEVIGGVCLLRMADIEEAVRWAKSTRFVVHGTLEVREVWRT